MIVWLAILPAGCMLDIEFGEGTAFRCEESQTCPEGQVCVEGICQAAGASGQPDGSGSEDPDDSEGPDSETAARVTDGLQLLYRLGDGSAGQTTVNDESGVGRPYDLTLADPDAVNWLPGAVEIVSPTAFTSEEPAVKIIDSCVASNELTLEAFVRAADSAQTGPARIATLSLDTLDRNLSLMQDSTQYTVRLRTQDTDGNGLPAIEGGSVDPEALQHLVYTRASDGTETLYLDGVSQVTAMRTSTFATWARDHHFAIGNELTSDRPWLGRIALVALYCRALTADEVEQNRAAAR